MMKINMNVKSFMLTKQTKNIKVSMNGNRQSILEFQRMKINLKYESFNE